MQWIRTHLKIVIPTGLVVLAGAAYLAFGFFGIQTLFIDDKVDEAGPVFDSGAGAEVAADVPATTSAPTTAVEANDDVVPEDSVVPTTEVPSSTEPTEPEIVTLAEGSFIPRGSYSGEGIATILTDGSEQRFLRFEQFSTDNGPDLNVYLTTAAADAPSGEFDRAGEFIDLGDLKGNIGDQNYEIPPDVVQHGRCVVCPLLRGLHSG